MEVSRYLGFILEPNLTKVAPDPTTPEELIVQAGFKNPVIITLVQVRNSHRDRYSSNLVSCWERERLFCETPRQTMWFKRQHLMISAQLLCSPFKFIAGRSHDNSIRKSHYVTGKIDLGARCLQSRNRKCGLRHL